MNAPTGSPIASQVTDDLRPVIQRLYFITKAMRYYGLMVLFLTLLTIAALIAFPFVRIFDGRTSNSYRTTILLVTSSAFMTLGVLALFEMRRKEGNTIFEEISDELQWRVAALRSESIGSEKASTVMPVREKPGIEARLTLRSFTQASDLPLVPGAFGPAVYAILNLSLVILSLIIPRFAF